MVPGTTMLLFLEHRSTGLHLAGGSRGAVAAAPAVLAHVRALITAATATQLARLLAAATLHDDARVRTDACLHLPILAVLDLDAASRAAIRTALADACERSAATLPALVAATVRAGGDDAAAALLRPFLGESGDDASQLLRAGLQRLGDGEVVTALATGWPTNDAARARAALLLRDRDPGTAMPLALRLLREAESPSAALAACEALLGLGLGVEELRELAPGPVVQLAQRRHAAPPRYRNVRREALR
jgi:hypothetical protein